MPGHRPHVLTLHANEQGVALLLVLWIIALLTVICAEFSWTMRTETATVRNFKDGTQAYYAAEAGINRAIIELLRTAGRPAGAAQSTEEADEETEEAEQAYWEAGSRSNTFEFAGFRCEVEIEDENNKIGLNPLLSRAKQNPVLLKTLLQENIGLEGEARDTVADALIDWYDKDHNATGINGAEDEYYESLDPPYTCRDGDIPVIEELLLVKGIDEEIFYGPAAQPDQRSRLSAEELEQVLSGKPLEEEPPITTHDQEEADEAGLTGQKKNLGMVNIFSITGNAATFKPNINTATIEQLLLLQGMDRETAREIIAARQEKKFQSTTDRLPQFRNYEVWKNNITVRSLMGLGNYTIRARGISPDGRIVRRISCVVMISKNKCVMVNWKAVD